MPTYDYVCESGHVTEARRGYDVNNIKCSACGQLAYRQPFYPTVSVITETGANSGYGIHKPAGSEVKGKHNQTRVSLFQEAASELDYNHKKQEESVGHELPAKPYFKMGLAQAKKIRRSKQ